MNLELMSNIWNNGSTLKVSTVSPVVSDARVCIPEQLKEEIKRYIVEELFNNDDSADLLNITVNYLRKELEKIMDNPEIVTNRNKEEEEKIVELEKMIDKLLCNVNILENRLDRLQETINNLNDRMEKLESWSSHVQSILSSSPNTPNSPNITWSTPSTGPQCIF